MVSCKCTELLEMFASYSSTLRSFEQIIINGYDKDCK